VRFSVASNVIGNSGWVRSRAWIWVFVHHEALHYRVEVQDHLAQRLVADGETVLDVPAKLSARVRVFATGQGRKTDPVDAHSVAVVA
jgi:hypothetical protein